MLKYSTNDKWRIFCLLPNLFGENWFLTIFEHFKRCRFIDNRKRAFAFYKEYCFRSISGDFRNLMICLCSHQSFPLHMIDYFQKKKALDDKKKITGCYFQWQAARLIFLVLGIYYPVARFSFTSIVLYSTHH